MTRESNIRTLKKRSDFLQIAASGRKIAAKSLVLQARLQLAPEATDGRIRVGYTASRRVGNAVARNRAKRRLRAAVAEVLGPRGASGHDYVLIARQGILERPFSEVTSDLIYALRKLDLLKD